MPKWNLSDIYDFRKTKELLAEMERQVKAFEKLRPRLSNRLSKEELMGILRKKEKMIEVSTRLGGYADLWLAESTSDHKRTAHHSVISQKIAEAWNRILFFNIWFKDLDEKTARRYISYSGKHHYFLERIRDFKKHSLNEREEQIVNLKDLTGEETLVKLYDITTNSFRYKWKNKLITQEEIDQYKKSPKREYRKNAYDLVLTKFRDYENLLGEIYKSLATDWRNENVKLRSFESPIQTMNLANNVPDESVEALLATVRRNKGVFQDYFRVKARLCGIKNMDRYDLYAPYSGKEKKYSYEEAKKIVLKTYKHFSPRAHEMAKKIFDCSHVHSEVIPNKRSGAFCYNLLNTLPPYIMLNYVGKTKDLFTMMHEFGHGIHGVSAAGQTNFTLNAGLPLSETASIFGEMLLSQRLLSQAGDGEKISILVEQLDGQYAAINRQAFFTLYEIKAHEATSEGATIGELNKIYLSNLREQFGGTMKVPEDFQHEWKYIPHIYHTPFYCYAYAFGNLLVLSLYRMYQEQGEKFVPRYLKLLSYGGSEKPTKILSELGVDITHKAFWQQGFDIIKGEVAQLKKLSRE